MSEHDTSGDEAARAAAEQPNAEPAAAAAPDQTSDADKAARAAASRGAQVVLDPDSPAAVAARGGAAATIHENTDARDADLIARGLDPVSPSGHLTDKPAKPPS
jgi:hypothetical protein